MSESPMTTIRMASIGGAASPIVGIVQSIRIGKGRGLHDEREGARFLPRADRPNLVVDVVLDDPVIWGRCTRRASVDVPGGNRWEFDCVVRWSRGRPPLYGMHRYTVSLMPTSPINVNQ